MEVIERNFQSDMAALNEEHKRHKEMISDDFRNSSLQQNVQGWDGASSAPRQAAAEPAAIGV